MNNTIKIIFTFTVGVAVGMVATQRFFKAKYEAIAQEDIDSVKETYRKKLDTLDKCREVYSLKKKYDDKEKEETYTPTKNDVTKYEDIIDEMAYTKNNKKGGSEPMKIDKIEVIPPDEFGYDGDNYEYSDYDCIGFTYYNNDILTDDGDFPIDDPETIVGPDALDSFGEWEDDRVCVRNDDRKCYYEILRDLDDYSGPQVEDE